MMVVPFDLPARAERGPVVLVLLLQKQNLDQLTPGVKTGCGTGKAKPQKETEQREFLLALLERKPGKLLPGFFWRGSG